MGKEVLSIMFNKVSDEDSLLNILLDTMYFSFPLVTTYSIRSCLKFMEKKREDLVEDSGQ